MPFMRTAWRLLAGRRNKRSHAALEPLNHTPPQPRDGLEHDVPDRDDAGCEMKTSSGVIAKDDVILDYVANSVVGKDLVFSGPFGQRRVLYLDYIASGRALTFIEENVNEEVLPYYANTHTATSITARQITVLRDDAREIIRRTTNATGDDAVIFTGNGATGAVHKLIHAMSLTQSTVVFVGPYEHHSNILPWRELKAEVIRIRENKDGLVDLEHLEEELQKRQDSGRRLVGSFSAASNVTGILCDVDAVSVLLHKYGAVALWDYATAGPYVALDMNPVVPGDDQGLAYKDAMFVSPHKFIGGVSTPGLLIAKRKLFSNTVPHHCGGGTVLVVRQTDHRYLQEVETREEGGTPNIIGSIRAGLVFQLKENIGSDLIIQREQILCKRAKAAWSNVRNLVVLGNLDVERLPVFSFLVHHPVTGYYLHHNFVTALLNDLFGIQARGGCACAGPYAMDLLGITEEKAIEIEQLLTADLTSPRTRKGSSSTSSGSRQEIKPGFTRLNLPYFMSEEQLEFVLQTVTMVAENGWKLLPQYTLDPRTGEWRHYLSQEREQLRRLHQLSYSQSYRQYPAKDAPGPPPTLEDCLRTARDIFLAAEKDESPVPDHSPGPEEFTGSMRWFLLPSEASELLRSSDPAVCRTKVTTFIRPRS